VPADSVPLPSRGFYMGTLPVPADGQSFDSAYAVVAGAAEFVPVWGRPTRFYELAAELEGWWGSTFVEGLTRGHGMFPLVHMSFIDTGMTLVTPPGMAGATLADPAWRAAYRQAALAIVRAIRPRFLSLGNEVNRWFEHYGTGGPNGFDQFVSLYEETYDSVKALSPECIVFCTFSRELVAENRPADLSVIDLFDKARLDLLLLTSYPYALAGINRPSDIPDDYYACAAGRLPDKPFGFSEVGWPSSAEFGGEEAQAEFLDQLTGRLTTGQHVAMEFLGWPWLTDLDLNDHLGLWRRDGTAKPAWTTWQRIAAGLPKQPESGQPGSGY